jgi:hypothetical protein
MPTAEQLPESLRPLVRRNAVRLTHERFISDVQGLISAVPVDAKRAPERQNPFPSAPAKHPPAFFFLKDEVLANFGYPREQEYRFAPAPFAAWRAAYIRVFPQSVQRQAGLSKMMELFESRKIGPMSTIIGGLVARNQYGPIIIDAEGANQISGLTQGFPSGELWGVSKKIFIPQLLRGYKDDEKIVAIPVISFEKLVGKVLENYVRIAESDLRFEPPFTVEIGASGLRDVFLACPGGLAGEGSFEGPIMEDIFSRKYELNSTDDASMGALLKSVFVDFYDLAACDRAKILTHDLRIKYGLAEI